MIVGRRQVLKREGRHSEEEGEGQAIRAHEALCNGLWGVVVLTVGS